MFYFKALFTATLLAATATTAWGKAEAILFASSDCSGADQSGTLGLSTGVCHSTFINFDGTGGYANSIHFYTDGVDELYYYYPEENCGGSPFQTDAASVCITGLDIYKSFKKAA
ncbi:hypothetical protein C8R45DRAFT_1104800 [Mycena sanguinolenta]|nr:hypothetical protein C8R45DRAFT_1104800 [Mycena sanguinolenta]